jgi:hypothetical protein
MRLQLKNGKTIDVDVNDYLDLSDKEWDDLMNSDYGSYVPDPFFKSKDIDLTDHLDFESYE